MIFREMYGGEIDILWGTNYHGMIFFYGGKIVRDGGQIIILGCAGRRGSIGFNIVSVCWSIGGAVLSVYYQYLGILGVRGGPMYVGLRGDWG